MNWLFEARQSGQRKMAFMRRLYQFLLKSHDVATFQTSCALTWRSPQSSAVRHVGMVDDGAKLEGNGVS